MNKPIKQIITASLILLLSGCGLFSGDENSTSENNKISRSQSTAPSFAEVDFFELGKDFPTLEISKNGIAQGGTTAAIMPQISGKVISVNFEIGDEIEKGDTILKLGDSLSTSATETQYQTALDSFNIALQSVQLTENSVEQNINISGIQVKSAYEGYKNAINGKKNAKDIYEEQKDNSEITIESAEDAYDFAKDSYNNTLDAVDDIEDTIRSFGSTPELENALKAAKAQADAAKLNKENAERGVDQANNALDILRSSYNSQTDQLDFQITNAKNQYLSSKEQLKATIIGGESQKLQAQSQLIQAESGLKTATLNIEQMEVKSPIDGFVTEILVEEGNMAGPGQLVAKVENTDSLTIKTSVNLDESTLIKKGATVKIESTDGRIQTTGEIIAISQTANQATKKIDIKIEISEKNGLIADSFVNITFSPEAEDRIFIPLNSVFITEEKHNVRVLAKNNVQYKKVEIGKIVGNYIEILGGLKEGDKIIMASTSFVEDGERVNTK